MYNYIGVISLIEKGTSVGISVSRNAKIEYTCDTTRAPHRAMFRLTDAQSKELAKQFNNEQFADVKIILDDDTCIHAHAMWLYTCSEYIRVMMNTPMQESQTRTIDMKGYEPEHVRLCIMSLYDPETAYSQIETLVGADADVFSRILNLASYGGFTRVQHLMEKICLRTFNNVWVHEYSAINILDMILNGPGQFKREIGTNIIDWCMAECENANPEHSDRAVLDRVLDLDLKHMTKLSKLCNKANSKHLLFRFWVHWYEHQSMRDAIRADNYFDQIIAKGIINIKNWKDIPDNMLGYIHRIHDTVTYSFILMGDSTLKRRIREFVQKSAKAV